MTTSTTNQAHPQLRVLTTEHPEPHRLADEELEWFFTMKECDQGLTSNFMASLVPARHREDDLVKRVSARTAERTIRTWLTAIDTKEARHAGVLQAAYSARPWPVSLCEQLDRLAGIMVRLASADLGLPDDDVALERLERSVAIALAQGERVGQRSFAELRKEADALYTLAIRAYERERGDVASVLAGWR